MSLLKDQLQASPLRGLPTNDEGDTSAVTSQSGETVQLYYSNSGVLTADAGQAAGVVVVGKTTYEGIQNALGDTLGSKGDKSLSFTSTAFTTEKLVSQDIWEQIDGLPFSTRFTVLAAAGILSSNGDYCVDYLKGVIYGKKASTQTSLTSVAYKYKTHVSTATVAGTVTARIQDSSGDTLDSTAGSLHVLDDNSAAQTASLSALTGQNSGLIPTVDSIQQYPISAVTGADQVLIASAADKQIWVYAVMLTADTADTTVQFQDEDDVAVTGIMTFADNGGFSIGTSGNFSMPLWKLATNKDLEVDVTTGSINGFIVAAIVSV